MDQRRVKEGAMQGTVKKEQGKVRDAKIQSKRIRGFEGRGRGKLTRGGEVSEKKPS